MNKNNPFGKIFAFLSASWKYSLKELAKWKLFLAAARMEIFTERERGERSL
jgi:hypothetical protein